MRIVFYVSQVVVDEFYEIGVVVCYRSESVTLWVVLNIYYIYYFKGFSG